MKNNRRCSLGSSRFIVSKKLQPKREVYAYGDWIRINEDLALVGWEATQRSRIHDSLKRGLPLRTAVKKEADRVGNCPLHSKTFF